MLWSLHFWQMVMMTVQWGSDQWGNYLKHVVFLHVSVFKMELVFVHKACISKTIKTAFVEQKIGWKFYLEASQLESVGLIEPLIKTMLSKEDPCFTFMKLSKMEKKRLFYGLRIEHYKSNHGQVTVQFLAIISRNSWYFPMKETLSPLFRNYSMLLKGKNLLFGTAQHWQNRKKDTSI